MYTTKYYMKHFWAFCAAIVPSVIAILAIAVAAGSNMISYYCSIGNSFFGAHLFNNPFCYLIVASVYALIGVVGLIIIFFVGAFLIDATKLLISFVVKKTINYFTEPKFKNVKVSWEEIKPGEILLKVENIEWRHPSLQAEAIVDAEHTAPNKGLIYEFGRDWIPTMVGNLKWTDTDNPGLTTIDKWHFKYLHFVHTDKKGNELYLDTWHDPVIGFPIGEHELWTIIYITIAKIKMARTIVYRVLYEGENKVSILSANLLGDMPQN